MTKVLFIAHVFPPIGGAGVQRPVKFVKHFRRFGIEPIVLTAEPRPGGRWKPEDQSLMADIPPGTVVHRTRWNVGAGSSANAASKEARQRAYVADGDQLIREHRPAAILVTLSPFEDAKIASTLAARHQLPWIADLRDPWALDEIQMYRTGWHRRRELAVMESSLATAASIIMNTPESAARFRAAFPRLASRSRVSITNGYDAEDFETEATPQSSGIFSLVHSGYLHTATGLQQMRHGWWHRLLGRMEPGVEMLPRSHYYLMQALERWLAEDPSIRSTVRLTLIGVPAPEDEAVVKNSPAGALARFTGYQAHADCVRQVESASALFLPMHHLPPGRRATIVPGKAYEYMASRRPIIAAVPDGDARDFLAACGTARICAPKDVNGLLAALKQTYEEWQKGVDVSLRWNREAVERFERKRLTQRMASELAAVIQSTGVPLEAVAQPT